MAEPAATQTDQPPKGALGRLGDLVIAAIPPLISVAGIVTFVALVGGAIQWVRFWAAGLPADQAVRAMPKAELVVIGAVSLIAALLAGVFVVLLVFLVERQAVEKRKVTMWVLLVLTTLELMVALVFVDEEWWVIALLAAWFAALGLVTTRALRGLPSILSRIASRRRLWAIRDRFERAVDDYADAEAQVKLLPLNGGVPPEAVEARNAALREATVERDAAKREWNRALDDWGVSKAKEIAALDRNAPPRKDDVFDALQKLAKRERRQPARVFERRLWGGLLLLTIAAGVVPLAVWSDSRWLLAVVAVVASLGAVNFMIARITPRFAWYGLAVFASVVLFGATLSIVDTIRSPKVQPMALLRTSDDRPICGAYVTETDDRVYVARVVPDAKGDGTQSKLGRVFWVDLDDVETVSVGPLQKVKEARARLKALADEIVADQPEGAPAKPKPVVETTTVRRSRGRRTVTVTTVREVSPEAAGDGEGTETEEPAAVGSCDPPAGGA